MSMTDMSGMSGGVGGGEHDEMNQEIPIDDPSQVVLHKEMLIDFMDESRDVRLSTDFLDFNFAEVGRMSESKQVVIKN